jgi:hypothetical protein
MNNEDVLKAAYPTDNIEILALRAEIERLRESARYDAFLRGKYRALISELVDALRKLSPLQTANILQRNAEVSLGTSAVEPGG